MVPPTFFPNLPTEVRELWLDPIAAEYGWPFGSLDDSTNETKWRYILTFMTLHEFNDLRWSLEQIDMTTQPFRPGSLDSVQGLVRQHVMGLDTIYASVRGSKERFGACADYIRRHGTIPAPIVLREVDGGMDILDGNHRLAALAFLTQAPDVSPNQKLPAWIGRNTKNAEQGGDGDACQRLC